MPAIRRRPSPEAKQKSKRRAKDELDDINPIVLYNCDIQEDLIPGSQNLGLSAKLARTTSDLSQQKFQR